jgi:short-subunit dehydrogenase
MFSKGEIMTASVISRAAPGSKYGQWAVVTGASDGIGKAFAELLAHAGFNLVVAARRQDVLAAVAKNLSSSHGVEVRPVTCDLGGAEGVALLEDATKELDAGLLVAAAGFGTSGPFLSSDLNAELEMIDVNCRAVTALAHVFGNRFVRRGGGAVVLLSSLVAFQGVPRAANYAATKAYVQTFAEGLRQELSGSSVDVLAVAPGPVRSGFGQRANMQMSMAQTPGGVARGALRALGTKGTVRPGFLAQFLELLLKPLPRWGRVRVMGLVMAGMTKHQQHVAQT